MGGYGADTKKASKIKVCSRCIRCIRLKQQSIYTELFIFCDRSKKQRTFSKERKSTGNGGYTGYKPVKSRVSRFSQSDTHRIQADTEKERQHESDIHHW